MRVLSFIPAFLLAATSFVAAAPTGGFSDPLDKAIGKIDANGKPFDGGLKSDVVRRDDCLQPIIDIIVNATVEIQPLSDELNGCKGSPDANTVAEIVVKITAVVSTTVEQLQATAQVDLTGLDLTSLCSVIYCLYNLILTILDCLVVIVIALGASAVVTVQAVICNLLNAVLQLVGCLKIFATAAASGVLGPVDDFICIAVDLLLSVVGGITVLVGISN